MPSRSDGFRIGYLSTFYHTSSLLISRDWPGTKVPAKWEMFPTGPAMMEAFGRGDLDVGYVGLTPAMVGIAKGIPVRCVAGGHMEGTVIIGRRELKDLGQAGGEVAAALGQFRGRALGTPTRGSIHDVILRNLLREHGLDKEVAVRNYPQADFIVHALEAGEVDGAAGTPALAVSAGRYAGAKLLVPPNHLWPNNPSYGIVASHEVIEQAPEGLEAFLRAHEEATRLIRREPRRAAAMTAHLVELVGEDFILDTYRVSPRYCAALPSEYLRATLAFVPILRNLGYIPRALDRDDVFDLRFIQQAHPEHHHYDEGLA